MAISYLSGEIDLSSNPFSFNELCVSCNGDGCDDCNKSGVFTVTENPLGIITDNGTSDDVWDLIRAAELAELGSWPILAGWLDQCKSFVDALAFVQREKKRKWPATK